MSWRGSILNSECLSLRNDESTQFVLPLGRMLSIVKKKPTTAKALGCLLAHPSYVVQQRVNQLVTIIQLCMQADEKTISEDDLLYVKESN